MEVVAVAGTELLVVEDIAGHIEVALVVEHIGNQSLALGEAHIASAHMLVALAGTLLAGLAAFECKHGSLVVGRARTYTSLQLRPA